jgi:CRISPR/Cas system-associated endonuclease Cas1
MAFIYFTEQGSKLLKSGNRLIVEKDGEKIADIPLIKIETI